MIPLVIILVLLILIILAALAIAGLAIGVYNKLIQLRNAYKNAFAQIDVQLKRRYDLIPNLVETAKAYMKHERETLEAVIAARNTAFSASQKAGAQIGEAGAMKELGSAEAGLAGALSRLMAVVEAYPDLKANQNMMQLTEELTATENKVALSRQSYNDAVLRYNNEREIFPNNLLAGFFNFLPAELFEVSSPDQREAPKVSFN